MRKMKNSGIEWIGEIPAEWVIKKLKYISDFKQTKYSSADGNLNYIGLENIVAWNGQYIETNSVYDREQSLICETNDILFGKLRPYLAKVYVSPKKQCCSGEFSVISIQEHNNKYMFYQLISHGFIFMVDRSTYGTKMPRANADFIKNMFVSIPEISEQEEIANYLDEKCSEIDAVIEKTKATIEEYKKLKQSVITEAVTKGIRGNRPMKDSGIEWIGEIPVEWNIQKGKWLLKRLERPVQSTDEVITCFRDGEVTLRSNRREDGFTFSLQEAGYQGIEPGDLVVHGMDGFAGAIGISDSRGKGTPVLNVMDCTESKRYIMYYLRNMAYNGIFIALATGIRVRSCDTNWNKLKELPYLIPSIEEQKEISDFIDIRLSELDSIITKKTNLLKELETYKKSLIYEYITGKKEVN